jgi:hypothetical protein
MLPLSKVTPAMNATAALAVLSTAIGTIANAGTQAPEPGSYYASLYMGSANGSQCLEHAGPLYPGEVSFSGLNGTKHYVRSPWTYPDEAMVSVHVLSVTSGRGTTSWKGKLTRIAKGYGGKDWNVSGSFTAELHEIGSHMFGAEITESYGNCTEEMAVSLVRVSSDQ